MVQATLSLVSPQQPLTPKSESLITLGLRIPQKSISFKSSNSLPVYITQFDSKFIKKIQTEGGERNNITQHEERNGLGKYFGEVI